MTQVSGMGVLRCTYGFSGWFLAWLQWFCMVGWSRFLNGEFWFHFPCCPSAGFFNLWGQIIHIILRVMENAWWVHVCQSWGERDKGDFCWMLQLVLQLLLSLLDPVVLLFWISLLWQYLKLRLYVYLISSNPLKNLLHKNGGPWSTPPLDYPGRDWIWLFYLIFGSCGTWKSIIRL